jgi:hypothetical protein
MSYGWKITFEGDDISDKVGRFSITASLESPFREMSLDIVDKDFYDSLDFSLLPETPQIEILTRIGTSFVSQGSFYLERPALSSSSQSEILQGVWGRSKTAALGEPFAPKVAKIWEEKTTFFAICEEMCDLAGLTWDETYSEIDDFVIHAYSFQVDAIYPIEVITQLAALAGALVTTDRNDHVCIKRIDYSPSAADATVTDAEIQEISESPEWPTFGNRVRITPSGSLAGYSVALSVLSQCLPADGEARSKLMAQVKDADSLPVNGLCVSWSTDAEDAALTTPTSNTQEIVIEREVQRATNYHDVDVDFPPSSVYGLYSYSDRARANNLADAGYTISGNTITLTESLAYCDQLLIIDYVSEGIAINFLVAGTTAETATITADIEGQSDSGVVYIDNPCQCPPTITLKASPSSIHVGEVASLLVYVEESGPATSGRTVFMWDQSTVERGSLEWKVARLGKVAIANEEATARNEVSGTTQCEISMFPDSVDSVYQADEEGEPVGADLYASHNGKTVDLTLQIATGLKLLVNYTASGAALNRFTGESVGNARIAAEIFTTREEGTEASTTISVMDVNESIEDLPEDWEGDEDDYGGVGGTDGEFDEKADAECHESGGTVKRCGSGERCCWSGQLFGCFPEAECTTSSMDPCFPKNVSADPSETALNARFTDALSQECSCELICNNEFSVFDTIQDYDGASYRTISEIVVEDYDYEEGTPEYFEKFEELKQEALDACVEACENQALQWDDESTPDTILPGGSISVYVLYGCPPFTWAVSGTGYSIGQTQTEGRSNQLNCAAGTCGVNFDAFAKVTVTDSCGGAVTGTIRNTAGQWILDAEYYTVYKDRSENYCTNAGNYCRPSDYTEKTLDDGEYRWILTPYNCSCVSGGYPCDAFYWEKDSVPVTPENYPPCGSAISCASALWGSECVELEPDGCEGAPCWGNVWVVTGNAIRYLWGC